MKTTSKIYTSLLFLLFLMISGQLILTPSLSAKTKMEKGADDEDEVKSTISSDPYSGSHKGTITKKPSSTSTPVVKNTYSGSVNEKEGKITLAQPIRFDDKNNLAIESQGIVLKFVDYLKKNPQNRVRISVHTDSLGSDQKNIENSQKRAQALGVYLIQNGIDMNRFELVGMGDRESIANDETKEGRQKNNRVEFVLITPAPAATPPAAEAPTPPPPPPAAPATPPPPAPAPEAPAPTPIAPSAPVPAPAPEKTPSSVPSANKVETKPAEVTPAPSVNPAPAPVTPPPPPPAVAAPAPTPPTPAPTPAPIQVPPPPVAK